MALTKHQKLAKGIKAILDLLDIDHPSNVASINFLQFYCHPSELIAPLSQIEESNFRTMLNTYRCSLRFLAPNKELQRAAQSLPIQRFLLPIKFLRKNRDRHKISDALLDKKWTKTFRWNVRIALPSELLPEFKKELMVKFLYCHSKDNSAQSINWFKNEDQENTFINQFFTFQAYCLEKAIFRKNLNQPVFENFQKAVLTYYQKIKSPRILKTLVKIELAPNPGSTNAQAYELLLKFTQSRRRKDFDDFKSYWRDRLETVIFANLKWTDKQKKAAITERFSPKQFLKKRIPAGRWKTGQSIDRQTYALFIYYFAEIFLENPKENQAKGEIVLLLWVMFYISLNPTRKVSLKRLLKLTTADVFHGTLNIDNQKIPLSSDLTNLIDEYLGSIKSDRQQKLFPHLTLADLEDYFHIASMKLLPKGSIPILPEAFLTFPHTEENTRIPCQSRRQQQKKPSKPLYPPILERK